MLLYSSSQRMAVTSGEWFPYCRNDRLSKQNWGLSQWWLSRRSLGFRVKHPVLFIPEKLDRSLIEAFLYMLSLQCSKHLHSVPQKVIRQPDNWGWPFICRNSTFNLLWTNERKTGSLHLNASLSTYLAAVVVEEKYHNLKYVITLYVAWFCKS